MAISVVAADVKRRLQIAVTTYDTDFVAICTEVQNGITAGCDSAALVTYENVIKLGIIEIAAGECLNALRRIKGYTEAATISGNVIGEYKESGDTLITTGRAIVQPYFKVEYSKFLADVAANAYVKALSDAQTSLATAMATALKDKEVNEAAKTVAETAKLTAEELKVDAETVKTAAETAKLTAEELKVDAETAGIGSKATLDEARAASIIAAELRATSNELTRLAAADDGGLGVCATPVMAVSESVQEGWL